MTNYDSAVYISINYEQPWGIINSPFETIEKEFMSYLEKYFPETFERIKNHNLDKIFENDINFNEPLIDCRRGFIHLVKIDENDNCTRMVFYYNPYTDTPLFNKLYFEYLRLKRKTN